MLMSTATSVAALPLLPPVKSKFESWGQSKHTGPNIVRIHMLHLPDNIKRGELQIANSQTRSSNIRCAAALNARCAAGQTQTLTKESPTITLIPGKEKTPKLDESGPGLPPGKDDDYGGNGGGGDKFSGGLILLGILGFLDILKDIESEWLRKNDRER